MFLYYTDHFLPLLLLLFRHATRCYQAPNLQSHPEMLSDFQLKTAKSDGCVLDFIKTDRISSKQLKVLRGNDDVWRDLQKCENGNKNLPDALIRQLMHLIFMLSDKK